MTISDRILWPIRWVAAWLKVLQWEGERQYAEAMKAKAEAEKPLSRQQRRRKERKGR